MLKPPIIALNLKAYAEATGKGAEKLVDAAEKLASKTKAQVIVCPQTTEVAHLAGKHKQTSHFKIYAQHVDAAKPGAATGSITAETLISSGCTGSLLNHSEKKVSLKAVEETVKRCKEAGLDLIVCADSLKEALLVAKFSPTAIAVEPPDLIGSGISISTARPEIVTDSVREIRKVNPKILVLVGAGVTTASDIKKAMELGADGILLASAYAKSKEPEKLLREMLEQL